jgi:surfeit locus 1 family protein
MSAPRLLLRPRLLVSHVLVLAVVATMIGLGLWQVRRLDEVRAINGRLEDRLAAAPVPIDELDVPGAGTADRAGLERLEFVQVTVSGAYATDEEVLQRGRALNGQSGYHVLTPLRLDDGRTLLVRRGWVPFELDEPPVTPALPQADEVSVVGWLELPGEQPDGFGQTDPPTGTLERVFHADTARLDSQVGGDLLAPVLHLEEQQPAQTGQLPVVVPRPEFSATTHLSYAVQWFSFSTIALVVYGLWLRKRVQREDRSGA